MRLKVSTEDESLLDLEMVDGKLQYHFVKEDLQPAVERWVTRGITEWIQDGPERHDFYPRVTYVDHPQFLFRLKLYLEKQFHFTYELIDEASQS
jgi:hypothetical protein